MAADPDVRNRILLLEQLTLELLRNTGRMSRRSIFKTMRQRFVYSKPLLELLRYAELELNFPNRDQVTKYSDFLAHRSKLEGAYDDDKRAPQD